MADFSYHHHPSLLDSIFLPDFPMKTPSPLEDNMDAPCFLPCPPSAHQGNSSPENSTSAPAAENQVDSSSSGGMNSGSISMIVDVGKDCNQALVDRKRKNRDQSSLSCAQSKDKGRKQHKCTPSSKKAAEKKPSSDKKTIRKPSEEPPTGYIHVRARRGQATDSHSLAERVRREKISERMKLLQGLVPGCETVTGKALVLDEIINYVQSLQHQVEFLSMKLASVNPIYYDFGAMDLDELMVQSPKQGDLPSQLPSVRQSNQSIQTSFAGSSAPTVPVANNYPLIEGASSGLLNGQAPERTVSRDNVNLLWDVEGQRQSFLSPAGYNNLCSFR